MFNSDRYYTPANSAPQHNVDYDDTVFYTKPCPFGACENPVTKVCSVCKDNMCDKHSVGSVCAYCDRRANEEN